MVRSLLGGLLDRIVLVAGTVAGGCIPSFVAQYRQRVGGRLDQVILDLTPFREIADRFHHGSLQELIQHHLASSDQTFHAEGAAIQAMVDAELHLRSILESLKGGLWDQLLYLVPHHDTQIVHSTWNAFVPSFTLNLQGLIVAAVTGLVLWVLFVCTWRLFAGAGRSLRRRSVPTHRHDSLSR